MATAVLLSKSEIIQIADLLVGFELDECVVVEVDVLATGPRVLAEVDGVVHDVTDPSKW